MTYREIMQGHIDAGYHIALFDPVGYRIDAKRLDGETYASADEALAFADMTDVRNEQKCQDDAPQRVREELIDRSTRAVPLWQRIEWLESIIIAQTPSIIPETWPDDARKAVQPLLDHRAYVQKLYASERALLALDILPDDLTSDAHWPDQPAKEIK